MDVRIGFVTDTDATNRNVRVFFPDAEIASGWLRVLNRGDDWMPEVNDNVLCLYGKGFNADGFVLGAI